MQIGVQITKSTLFRGVQQEFHNVYNYKLGTAITAPSESIVDEIVNTEKSLHSSEVKFIAAAVWSSGGNIAQNAMLFKKSLSPGAGNQLVNTNMDRERAILIRWPAGFAIDGRPVYLRKYFHSCGNAAGVNPGGAAQLANIDPLLQATRDAIALKANELRDVGATEFWELVAKTGRQTAGNAQCHPFLEHHQLGDMWRI